MDKLICTQSFERLNILVVGCGGLGNEVIKNLIFLHIKNITIVDYDIVEVSNLQRQLFFSHDDIGKYKVDVISYKIKETYMHDNICIKSYKNHIEEFDSSFFEDFDYIIGCLDNIKGRIYLNSIIYNLRNDIIYIDGGIEGFKGNVKIINRKKNYACIQCSIKNYTNSTYPMCSIINNPKTPEECILYVLNVSFKKEKSEELNINNIEHIQWVYEEAKKRAQYFHIENVTYNLTEQVITNTIPTTISTLMIISSLIINILYKLVLYKNENFPYSDILYVGDNGIYTYYYHIYKDPQCVICNKKKINLTLHKNYTLNDLIELIKRTYLCEKINISSDTCILYISSKCVSKIYNHNLQLTLSQLIDMGQIKENGYLNIQTDKSNYILFFNLV